MPLVSLDNQNTINTYLMHKPLLLTNRCMVIHDRWQDNQSPYKVTRSVTRAIKTTIEGL